MKEAIERFCREREKGLFLLDMPTGFGKTYSVLTFIADNYDNKEYSRCKFFFVTTLKKNLPYDELREHFKKRGKEKDFERLCIRLNANADGVIENLLPLYKSGKIPKHITQKTEFKELYDSVTLLMKYSDKNKFKEEAAASLCKNTKKNIDDVLERKFRKLVTAELAKFRTPGEKLREIANNRDYHWIGELYPAVYSREKRIFFMSMDKFILGNSTIIEPTYSFYNNSFIEKSIIFIDEFDATKDKILGQIIRKGMEQQVDYITLFTQIHSALKMRSFPSDLITDSGKQKEYLDKHPRAKTCRQLLDDLEKLFDETYRKFQMQYSFKTKERDTKGQERNFIFNDLQFHSVYSGEKTYIQIQSDNEARQNWLRFVRRWTKDSDYKILEMLFGVRGCITCFQNGCRQLARNYKQLQDERKNPGDDDLTIENAVISVLQEFHLSGEYQRYLAPIILSGTRKRQLAKGRPRHAPGNHYFEKSIYDRGFRYYDFIDDPNHNMQSEIRLYDFQISPERILLCMAERARVIGISATATLDTVLGNYDIEYLQSVLQEDFYQLPEKDEARLRANFSSFTGDYEKVNMHVEMVKNSKDPEENLKEIFTSPALVQKYTEKLENTFGGREKHSMGNFLRVVKVLKQFIENDYVRSFLCLSNKLAQDNKADYDLGLLREFADEISKETKRNYKGRDLVAAVSGDGYDAQYKTLIRRLSEGEKIFVVSSYYTIGAGQNLQYKKPDQVQTVRVSNDARGNQEKDFDGIYLEKPTHMIVNVDPKSTIKLEELIRFIYQVEFLMERGEVSRKDGIGFIKAAFGSYSGGKTGINGKRMLYQTLSVNNAVMRVLIQAVGRICRTGSKNRDIYLFLDEQIIEKHDFSKVEHRLLNPEFKAIADFAKKIRVNDGIRDDQRARLENMAGQLSIRTMQGINELKSHWTEESIECWKSLRENCLMYPTISDEEMKKMTWMKNIYMRAPEKTSACSYMQEGDYNKNTMVKFDDSLPQKMSEEEVHLPELMHIEGLRAHFANRNYAVCFTPNEYLLTPAMFNNIYKGALGEAAGRYILEKYLPVHLSEVPDQYFELFDFVTGGDIYIDFKLWKDTMHADAKAQKEKIINKLQQCHGRRAVIINIVYDRDMDPVTSSDGKIVEIPYLFRLDKKEIAVEMLEKIMQEGYLR